ncbi:MAG: YbhB/YbcL family Raf kinase inhibitor-like protein [Gemmatimonadota bacterium]|nr:YbhB/YbcL family Raf kinase inhibitor-like protein [Gemmatimonadota bacterium]MDH4349098.1 YbhB/YbcL family Raf kinase inhibitor-like protein [Gemmatimonadota bacterium]MDH5284624.1 YbhB/YbcL family Raf kinase inhibitor-like protein [Gemmatimonadota bacterium]
MSFALTSTAFQAGAEIPARFTCEGEGGSPPLAWAGVPPGTKSLALIVDDPDAPDPEAPRIVWVHWLLYNLPAESTGLAEGISPSRLPPGTCEGITDFKRTGWGGPCPPIGRHRYFFRLYALDATLPDLGKPTRVKLEQAMEGHVIARAELMGTYQNRR